MDILWILLVCAASIGIGFYLSPYLKKKGMDETSIDLSNQLLLLSRIVTMKIIKDEGDKTRVSDIFNTIQDCLVYTYTMSTDIDDDQKITLTKNNIINNLKRFDIELDDQEFQLIELLVGNFVKFLPDK